MFSPSEKTLKKLQITRQTYLENDLFIATWSGICRWTVPYSAFYFFSMIAGTASAIGFILSVWSVNEEWEKVLENIHVIPLIVNMAAQVASYHYRQSEYLQLLRAIDEGFFDYEETLDEQTKEEIADIRQETKKRKKVFGHYFTVLLCATSVLQLMKKPVTYVIRGEGMKEVDGENSLMWETPFGMFMPYAEHWLPYLFATLMGYSSAHFILVTGLGSVLQYQYISEELLAEFSIVEKTLSKCVERAEAMYRIRMFDVFRQLMYYPLFAVIFDGGFILCISSYILINDDLSTTFRIPMPWVIAVEATMGLIFCYYGQRLADASMDVGNGLYNGQGWIAHSQKLLPYALIVNGYCDIPNELTAAGFTNVNLQTFANILSAAYSYIGFMLST